MASSPSELDIARLKRYQWQPLKDQVNFRLLWLYPAMSLDDLLVVALSEHSEQSQPEYTALSYFWGDPKGSQNILVLQNVANETHHKQNTSIAQDLTSVFDPATNIHARRILIHENLFRALSRLRSTAEPVQVWTDFLCISQTDEQEKANQISLMRRIYSSAKSISAWLGETTAEDGSDGIQRIITTLNDIDFIDFIGAEDDETSVDMKSTLGISGQQVKFNDIVRILRTSDISVLEDKDISDNPNLDTQGILQKKISEALNRESNRNGQSGHSGGYFEAQKTLRAFFARPWFHRVWVVQEALPVFSTSTFGSNKISFLCGSVKLDAISVIMAHWCCSVMQHDYEIIGRMTPFNQCVLTMKLKDPLRLIDLLDHCQPLKASDPRDHCFALVGISEHAASDALRANYQESVKSTYKRFTRYLISKGHGSRILLMCFKSSESLYFDLPSWVPDWSSNPCLEQTIPSPYARWMFSAGGSVCESAVRCGNGNFLLAKGLITDRVTVVHHDSNLDVKKFASLHEWGLGDIMTLRLILALKQQYLVCMLWRAVTGKSSVSSLAEIKYCREDWEIAFRFNVYDVDLLLDQRISTPLPKSLAHILLVLLEFDRDGIKKCLEEYPDLTSNVLHGIFQRKAHNIGVTDHRRLVRLPASAKEGDVIAIVLGCCMPPLLSPRPVKGKTVYKVRGMAYDHGIMDGEALGGAQDNTEQLVFI